MFRILSRGGYRRGRIPARTVNVEFSAFAKARNSCVAEKGEPGDLKRKLKEGRGPEEVILSRHEKSQ